MNNLTHILSQKPFNRETAIKYSKELSNKYNKIYCVVSLRKLEEANFDIIAIRYYRTHMNRYNIHYISIPNKLKC